MNQFHVSDKLRDKGIYWSESCIVVDGCTKVSEGCLNCWAESMHKQFHPGGNFSKITVHLDRFEKKLKAARKKSLVWSLWNDVCHSAVTGEQTNDIYWLIDESSQHTFLILTKRPRFIRPNDDMGRPCPFPPNLWLGTTAENQEWADKRIPELLKCGSPNLFVSLEPLLGFVDLESIPIWNGVHETVLNPECWGDCACGDDPGCRQNGGDGKLRGVDWVIVGCETGPNRRLCDPEWIRSIVRQCQAAEVVCWVKAINVDSKVIRHWKDWPAEYEDLRVREFPGVLSVS